MGRVLDQSKWGDASRLKMKAVQGTFVECASPAHVTLWLASVVLELVAAREVHSHNQPFVRRSALIAASQAGFRISASLNAGVV